LIIEGNLCNNCSDNGTKGITGITMADYKKMYFALFNAVTSAINHLQDAQRDGKSEYIETQDSSLTILPTSADEKPKATE